MQFGIAPKVRNHCPCVAVKSLYNQPSVPFSSSVHPKFPALSYPSVHPKFQPHQSLPHLHFLVSPLPQFPFLIYWNPTQLLKWWLLNLMYVRNTLEHLKSYSQHSPSQRFRCSGFGVEPKMRHCFISSPVNFETHVVAFWKPLLYAFFCKLSQFQHSINCSSVPTVLAHPTSIPLCGVLGAIVQGSVAGETPSVSLPIVPRLVQFRKRIWNRQ